eukprot:13366-Heterococcus_DN1.PRE.8
MSAADAHSLQILHNAEQLTILQLSCKLPHKKIQRVTPNILDLAFSRVQQCEGCESEVVAGAMFSRGGGGEPLSPGSMALAALSAGGMARTKAKPAAASSAAGGGEESTSKAHRKRSSVAAAAGSRFARMGSHLPSMSAVHSADRAEPAAASSSSSSSRVPTGMQPRSKPMTSALSRQASAMSSASERDEVPAVTAAQLTALIGAQIEKLLPRGTSMGGTRTEANLTAQDVCVMFAHTHICCLSLRGNSTAGSVSVVIALEEHVHPSGSVRRTGTVYEATVLQAHSAVNGQGTTMTATLNRSWPLHTLQHAERPSKDGATFCLAFGASSSSSSGDAAGSEGSDGTPLLTWEAQTPLICKCITRLDCVSAHMYVCMYAELVVHYELHALSDAAAAQCSRYSCTTVQYCASYQSSSV